MDKLKSCWKKIPIPVAFMLCSITAILLALLFTNITMRFAQSGQAMIQEKYVEIDLDDLKPANDSEGLVEAVPGEDTEKFQLRVHIFLFGNRKIERNRRNKDSSRKCKHFKHLRLFPDQEHRQAHPNENNRSHIVLCNNAILLQQL